MPSASVQRGSLRRRLGRRVWVAMGFVLAALHILPWFVPSVLHIMIMIFLFTVMGQGWNILGGYAGQFSFGHSLFFGLGAYVSTLLFINLGLSPWIGIGFSCAAGIILGLFIFRTCFTLCIGITWTFIPFLASTRLGLSSSAIGLVVMVNVLVAGLFQAPMGFLADRFSKRLLVTAGGVLAVFAILYLNVAATFVDLD